ncbi:uncharacterized protein IUM83_00814 [Phytophthora cinnamomi]|uniref:uncharacterized protein n=1 Tax=Phytophthora cinnamomi TaxID=4785 RepID=UPI0035596FDE|nr:hypothetical protein IUM83_00814 [Phytophthora cinnamomi]
MLFALSALLPQTLAVRLGVTIPESSTCSHINSEYSACKVQSMCSLCITTGTCEFDVESLSCEAKSTEAIANGTATTYCSSNDTVCSTCDATAADPICTGEDGSCICQSLCSVVQPVDTSSCSSTDESVIAYIGIAVGMVCVGFFVFLTVKCRRRYLQLLRLRSFESQRRRESELLRMRQPQLALNLVGWRDTVDLNKPELHKLGACSYIMKQEESSSGPTGAVAAISVGEEEPSTSMETSSTLSEVIESPMPSPQAPSPTASHHGGEYDYSAMSDSNHDKAR